MVTTLNERCFHFLYSALTNPLSSIFFMIDGSTIKLASVCFA